jgi:hypothetical protein
MAYGCSAPFPASHEHQLIFTTDVLAMAMGVAVADMSDKEQIAAQLRAAAPMCYED